MFVSHAQKKRNKTERNYQNPNVPKVEKADLCIKPLVTHRMLFSISNAFIVDVELARSQRTESLFVTFICNKKSLLPICGIVGNHLDGQRVGAGPSSNLLAKLQNLRNGVGGNLGLEVLELVGLLGELALDLLAEVDGLVDVAGNALEVVLGHTTGGHGRSTDTDTAGGEGRLVTGDGVLVAGNVDLLKDGLDTGTVEALGAQVEEDHVAVSTVRDELVAESLELVLNGLGVLDDLLLVLLELRGVNLLQGNSQSGDGVVVGATLVTGEDGEVDGVLQVVHDVLAGLVGATDTLTEEDHGTTRTTEGLVGGGGDDIGVLEGRGDDTSGDQTGDVSHVNNEVGTDLVGDLAHALVVNQTAVGRGTGNETLGAVHLGVLLEGVVVNDTGLKVDTVREGLKVGGDSRDPTKLLLEKLS